MSDTTIKNLAYILAAFLSIYPVIEFFKKQYKWYIRFFIGVFIVFFWIITIKYKGVIDKESAEANAKASTAESANTKSQNKISELKSKVDSSTYYLKALQDSFKFLNIPENQRRTINNYIKKVGTLNQY